MFYIYESIISIKKRLLPKLIIVIALVIAFSSAIEFISYLSAYRNMTAEVNKLKKADVSFYELYTTQDINLLNSERSFNEYNDFIKNLSSTVNVRNITNYLYKNYQINIENKDMLVNMLIVNKDIDKYYNINLSKGRYFSQSEFNKSVYDTRPIILGSYFEGKIKLGDSIDAGKMKFKVIGFLEKNSPFTMPRNSEMYDTGIALLDEKAILPITKEEANAPDLRAQLCFNGLIIETDKNTTLSALQKEISSLTKEKGFSYYATNPEKLLGNKTEALKSMIFPLILSGVVLIFSLFSIILISLTSLYMERKNIAIKLALGASDFQISISYIIENILLFIISIYFCTAYFKWDNNAIMKIDETAKNEYISFLGNLHISGNSIVVLTLISFVMLLTVYFILRINIVKIKTNYMKEVV